MNKKIIIKNILGLIGVVSFATVMLLIQKHERTPEKLYENELQISLNSEYRGVVVKKFRDRINHNAAKIVLKSGYTTVLYDKLYDMVKVNDSMVKRLNETITEIYRGNKKIIFNHKSVFAHRKITRVLPLNERVNLSKYELIRELNKIGVHGSEYSLCEGPKLNAYVIDYVDEVWMFYYYDEIGSQYLLNYFIKEADAYNYLLNKFIEKYR